MRTSGCRRRQGEPVADARGERGAGGTQRESDGVQAECERTAVGMGAAERRLADAAERAEADQAALQKCAAEAGALGEAAEAAAACSAVRRELAAEAGKLRAALEERSAALDAALAAEAKATAAAGVTAEQAWLQTSNLGATSAQLSPSRCG